MSESRFEPVRSAPALTGTPHSRGFYAAVTVFALAATAGFSYGTIAASSGVLRLVEATIAAVFLGGTIQAGNRLLRPLTADRQTVSMPEERRRVLRRTGTVLVRVSLAFFLGGALMHISNSDQISGLGSDMQVFGAVLFFAAWCVADASGGRLQAPKKTFRV